MPYTNSRSLPYASGEPIRSPSTGIRPVPCLVTGWALPVDSAISCSSHAPRLAMPGEAISTDNLECQLKPLRKEDYYPITFTEAQWKALEKAFPTGVCDFSKPGVDQQHTIPWQTYENDGAGGSVVYGGKALGAAPVNSGEGWTSATFSGWRK